MFIESPSYKGKNRMGQLISYNYSISQETNPWQTKMRDWRT